MNKQIKKPFCDGSKLTEKEKRILRKILATHRIENLNYDAKLINASDNFIMVLSSNISTEERMWIFYYTLIYFATKTEDTIFTFELTKKNYRFHKRVYETIYIKKFSSKKILKLIGDLNEKF